jgi:hypothetical protein
VKACQAIEKYAREMAEAVGHPAAVRRVIGKLRAICAKGRRMNKREKHPNTFQQLVELSAKR